MRSLQYSLSASKLPLFLASRLSLWMACSLVSFLVSISEAFFVDVLAVVALMVDACPSSLTWLGSIGFAVVGFDREGLSCELSCSVGRFKPIEMPITRPKRLPRTKIKM